ncbi:MAG: hypothetical protein WAN35_14730 [Terracidiphilus sp.]
MRNKYVLMTAAIFVLMAKYGFAETTPVNFNFYVDDYGTVAIDGTQVGSYDNPASAGNIIFTDNLTPGWHTFAVDYANQTGTNFLALQWDSPGTSVLSPIPLTDFSSLDQNNDTVSGLRADYFSSLGGSYLFTVYGEGPIMNGALSYSSEIYENQPGLWAGTFGPSAIFGEDLSGEIYIPSSTPEPPTLILVIVPLLAFICVRSGRQAYV